MVIAPVICGAEAPPRLCDPPCSEKQAGIGPISLKPELLTTGALTEMVGKSTWGRGATGSSKKARAPAAATPKVSRMVATGRSAAGGVKSHGY
jgi:hypothetical protein